MSESHAVMRNQDVRLRTAGILGALSLLLACSRNTSGPADELSMTLSNGRPAVILTDEPQNFPHDAYEFRSLRIAGDTLEVTIRHGGGCATHEYALLLSTAWRESYPVQVGGTLAHDAKGDPCRALLEPTLHFELTPLKDAYRRAYRTTSGAVTIHVRNWPQPVEYRF